MKNLILTVLAALLPMMATAELFSFYGITGNNPANQTTGENQMFVEVDDCGVGGHVSILFTNTGPTASSLKSIYFDTLDPYVTPPIDLQISNIVNGAGVEFVEDKKVKNFNGGNPLMAFSSNLSLGNEGGNANSIDPGEYLIIHLTYTQPPYCFIDMLRDGDLQIGIHVGAFPDGGSEKFVNVIPEPSTALLLGFSGLLVKIRRDYRKKFCL